MRLRLESDFSYDYCITALGINNLENVWKTLLKAVVLVMRSEIESIKSIPPLWTSNCIPLRKTSIRFKIHFNCNLKLWAITIFRKLLQVMAVATLNRVLRNFYLLLDVQHVLPTCSRPAEFMAHRTYNFLYLNPLCYLPRG